MIREAYNSGHHAALVKFALAPPTQVDEFVQSVEHGKDVPPPEPAMPEMPEMPEAPPALDGTTPLSTQPSAPPMVPPAMGV